MASFISIGISKLGASNGIVTLCLFFLCLLALAILAHYKFYVRSKRFNELASKLPGPKRIPFIGSAYEFGSNSKDILQNFVKMTKIYKPLSGHWFGPVLYVCLFEAEDIDVILSSTTMMDKTIANDMMKSGIGDSLLANSGQIWKKHRRYINPAFHNNVMDKYLKVFFTKTEIMASVLKPYSGSAEVNIIPFMQNCIFDILCETMMSTKSNLQNSKATQNRFIESVISCVDITHRRFFNPLHYIDFVFNRSTNGIAFKGCIQYIHSFIKQSIARRRKEIQIKEQKSQIENGNKEGYKNFKRGSMFLDYVLENAGEGDFSDQEILDETVSNMIGGFDSTSFTLSMLIFILSKRFDIQEYILEEIKDAFGGLDTKGYSVKQLDSLKYLDRVIKETLRLFSPVPYFARQVTEETKLPSGYVLPKDCAAILVVFCVHKNPDFYPNPEVFDPDRFLPERIAERPACSYRPFSAGRRSCIAQKFAVFELKSAVVSLLRKYWLTPVDVRPNLANKMNLFATNGLKIGLERRTPHRPQMRNYESLSREILTNIQEYNVKFKQSY